jgi:hypothetical protein
MWRLGAGNQDYAVKTGGFGDRPGAKQMSVMNRIEAAAKAKPTWK